MSLNSTTTALGWGNIAYLSEFIGWAILGQALGMIQIVGALVVVGAIIMLGIKR